jgi:carbon-monoxide dehydrogenase medium subunit
MVATSARGARSIAADEFFRTWFTTALEPDEVLTEVRFPVQDAAVGSSCLEVARRHGDFAQAGVAATVRPDGDVVGEVRLVAFAAGPAPVRLHAAERALQGRRAADDDAVEAAALAAAQEVQPGSDVHSSADYKRDVLRRLVARAVREAVDDARSRDG